MGHALRLFILKRLLSIQCALAGVAYVAKSQRNAWVHLLATLVVVTCGLQLRLAAGEWCWLLIAIGAVWVAESLNTALEWVCDAACLEFHPLIGRAKDVAAGGVLLAAVTAMGIGGCVMGPHIFGATP